MTSSMSEAHGSKAESSSVGNRTRVGSLDSFWLWSAEKGFDLSRPADPDSGPFPTSLRLECQVSDVMIDPAKTALLIIDLQNFTLSQALRTGLPSKMFEVEEAILKYAIPSARKAGIQIVWLN